MLFPYAISEALGFFNSKKAQIKNSMKTWHIFPILIPITYIIFKS